MRSRYTCTPGSQHYGTGSTPPELPTVREVELGSVLAPRTGDEMVVAVGATGGEHYVTLRRGIGAEPVEFDPRAAMETAETLMRAAHLAQLAQQTGDHDLMVASATYPAA